jgi:CRISPR system Cascade subunit CasA
VSYSVVTAPWVPVRLADGSTKYIAPWQITERIRENPVVDIVHPRPDFTGAARELVIGLLQACLAPATETTKLVFLGDPPDPAVVGAAFSRHSDRFELIEGDCRFLQDMGGVPGQDPRPIDCLQMNGPGENARNKNKDFFIRRDEISHLCPACTVLALSAKQFYASGTGPGFRTSPRGGGPLTTLLEFTDEEGSPAPLWYSLYANVMPLSLLGCDGLNEENAPRILPWLAPLRISKRSKVDVPTTLEHAHPLQVFFPMPSRAEVVWQDAGPACACDACGKPADRFAVGWKTAQYGVMYQGIEHPLTPYRLGQKNEKISMKPKLDGISYPHWLVATLGVEGSVTPARNIQSMQDFLPLPDLAPRIRAYGYQMDNASALCWHESVLPFIPLPEHLRKDFSVEIGRIVGAAQSVSSILVSAIKEGLFRRPGDASGDMSHIQRELIASTTGAFFDLLQPLAAALDGGNDIAAIKLVWLETVRREALQLFDHHAPIHVAEERNLKRLVNARRKFSAFLYGKKLCQDIDIPIPVKAA